MNDLNTIVTHSGMAPNHGPSNPRRIQSGSGRRNKPDTGKGRQLDPTALEEVRERLRHAPRDAEFLIEHLHLLQDHFGCLHARHLRALAEEMRLPMAHVFEVASFYAHFDIVLEDETPPPPITVRVCDSLSCMLAGAEKLENALKDALDPAAVRVVRAPCMGRCATAPVAEVDHRHVDHAIPESIIETIEAGAFAPVIPGYTDFASYQADGGYRLFREIRGGTRTINAIIETLSDAGLRGLGGAGFPAGKKWEIVRGYPGPRLMTVNGDEGEPGTFKDRYHLERDPHRFLEGMLIAAHAVEAERIYIYMRDEYPAVLKILGKEIAALENAGLIESGYVVVRRGAGAYICGEESAMIESIEGKRGLPRHRPPYIAEVGLFGKPTLNHNVETLFWVRDIIEKGADWFASQGLNGAKGFRSWSVSGRVKNPGVIIAPAGITVAELIERAGGMAEGHTFKAYLPGGASGGILPASMADIPLDFGGRLAELGCFVGSHAIVILSDQDDMRAVALNLMRFFEDESCGQCTPCRNGTAKAVALMEEPRWDAALLSELADVMADASICGLGQAAPNPLRCVMEHFPEEIGGGT